MPLGSIFTWIANHVGLGAIKNATGIYKDKVDIKKTKLETQKLQKELEPSLIQPATFQDVKDFDPKIAQIQEKSKVTRMLPLIWQIILLLLALLSLFYGAFFYVTIDNVNIGNSPPPSPISSPRRR